EVEYYGQLLIDIQMVGLLLGGLLWGVFGDKRGRLSVLFGSILIYSFANIANGFVTNVTQYAILRFIAGIGLAGELGAGITLVNEVMSKKNRGYGVTIVATVGLLGAVVASLVGDRFDWRIAFFVGGGMGLLLLALRIGVAESGLFRQSKHVSGVKLGSLKLLFSNKQRLAKYIYCILGTVPVWYVVGLLVAFCKEFGEQLGMARIPTPGWAILYCYIGLSIGDMLSGLLSQWLRSRKKVQYIFIIVSAVLSGIFLFNTFSLEVFYGLCFVLGIFSGYWVISITSASEQFGTNLRATVTTSVPNFVRGSLVLVHMGYFALKGSLGMIYSAAVIGLICFVVAYFSVTRLEETFGRDLNYFEE
ncbi:MAG: MFS transporter, partial [Bacteroidota bacterium]